MSQEALNAFSSKFVPADENNHTFLYSTSEIGAMLYEHSGVEVPATDIYNHMIEKGFRNDFADGRFVWYLKHCPSVSAPSGGHSEHADSSELAQEQP